MFIKPIGIHMNEFVFNIIVFALPAKQQCLNTERSLKISAKWPIPEISLFFVSVYFTVDICILSDCCVWEGQ